MLEQAQRMNEVAYPRVEWCSCRALQSAPWIDEMFDKVLLVTWSIFSIPMAVICQKFIRVLPVGRSYCHLRHVSRTMTKWPFAGPETHKLYDRNEHLDFLVDA